MSFRFWLFGVDSREFFQAEKERSTYLQSRANS